MHDPGPPTGHPRDRSAVVDGAVPIAFEARSRRDAGRHLPVLLWRFPEPLESAVIAPHGGGVGPRRWLVATQATTAEHRRDPDHLLGKLATSLGLAGRGIGILTASDIRLATCAVTDGVGVVAIVGATHPVLAAAASSPSARPPRPPATTAINIVVTTPVRLSKGALLNALATATEAKTHALLDAGFHATGTAADALCVLCPTTGAVVDHAAPRTSWGTRIARAVHDAVLEGVAPPPP